jgi:hypothetical protein
VNADRITYAQLSRLTGTRDKRTARTVENAVRGINAAQHAIRRAAAMIRSKLAETVQRLGDDLTVAEAIARLRGGGPVTVTVTDPAPPGGDPR